MALLNASGQPVALKAQMMQIDIPAEPASGFSFFSVNWFDVIPAVLALVAAFASGDSAKIMAAIAAFFKAILGCLLLLVFVGSASAQPAGWPNGVPLGGLKEYTPAKVSQYIVVRDDRPFHAWHSILANDPSVNVNTVNPNAKAQWRQSGGMDGMAGWKSTKLTNVSAKDVKVDRVNIPIAGAGRALPGFRWSYPDGTTFADLLTGPDGRPFELRTRTKKLGKWQSSVVFEDASASPKGYLGAGRCATCHEKAGDSQQYGIMIRGDDQCFSFLPVSRH